METLKPTLESLVTAATRAKVRFLCDPVANEITVGVPIAANLFFGTKYCPRDAATTTFPDDDVDVPIQAVGPNDEVTLFGRDDYNRLMAHMAEAYTESRAEYTEMAVYPDVPEGAETQGQRQQYIEAFVGAINADPRVHDYVGQRARGYYGMDTTRFKVTYKHAPLELVDEEAMQERWRRAAREACGIVHDDSAEAEAT